MSIDGDRTVCPLENMSNRLPIRLILFPHH